MSLVVCVCFFPILFFVLPDFSLRWLQTRILDVNKNGFLLTSIAQHVYLMLNLDFRELLKSGTGRDGMGQSRILNYGTGRNWTRKPSYSYNTIEVNLVIYCQLKIL